MEKKMNNEELQSRREFFKSAAKVALPVVAAAVMANTPAIVKASEVEMGCKYGCTGVCYTSACQGTCQGGCRFTCSGNCQNTNKA